MNPPRSKLRGIQNGKERSKLRGIHPERLKIEAIKKAYRLGLKYHPDMNSCQNRKVDNSLAKKKGETDD